MMWNISLSQKEKEQGSVFALLLDIYRCAASLRKKGGLATSVTEAYPHLHIPIPFSVPQRFSKSLFQHCKSFCMQQSQFLILYFITGARNTSVFQDQKWMSEDVKTCTFGMLW